MRYRRLGKTGMLVSEICLGTMTFGSAEGFWKAIAGLEQESATALVKASIEAGVNFFDTANAYSAGVSETMLGQAFKALGSNRDDIVIATKVFGQMGPGVNSQGLSRKHILSSVEASLKRMQTDYIDLYQIHGRDPATPIEETLDALDSLVKAGKVRYTGYCNISAWEAQRAESVSQAKGYARFESAQMYYSIAGRDIERETVPMAQANGLAILPWSPLAGGLLSGKFYRDAAGPNNARRAEFDFPPVDKDRGFDCIDAMRPIAEAHGYSVAAVALAWLLAKPWVTSVIIGAKTDAQLADNLTATAVKLTEDDLATLDKVSRLPREYPGWMYERQGGRAQYA
jgi:aryl-alcohol dehydrogenase-like predicted oxidoreductase